MSCCMWELFLVFDGRVFVVLSDGFIVLYLVGVLEVVI